MHEIKLRAWSKTAKVMHPVWLKLDDEAGEYILMQFIGLKDRNGKEIYEGDIVKGVVCYPQLLTGDTDGNSNINMGGIVFYDLSGFSMKVIEKYCSQDRYGLVNYFSFIGREQETFEKIEVIGNIYENPELLK